MKLRFLLLLLCGLLLLGGCTPLESNVENLLQPPKLTELQTQVDKALRDAVGRDFKLKYPKTGDHRSAFNFLDMDGDKTDEAIAFYSLADDNIQIAILRQLASGDWMVSDIVPGLSFCTEVDFLSMQTVGAGTRLLVGWGGTGLDNNLLAIYDYDPTGGSSLGQPSRWEYSKLTVTDLYRNGQREILLLVAPDSYADTPPMAQLVGESKEGSIELLSEVELPRNITGYYPPVEGSIGNNLYGLAADCVLNNGNLCTITLAYDGRQLLLPLNELTDVNLFRQTVRKQSVLSCDINKDGVVDIPVERLAPGYSEATADAIYFIDYSNHRSNLLVPVQSAYLNQSRGFRFLFPHTWDEQPISAVAQPDMREVVLFVHQGGNLYDHSQELVRFQIYSALDAQDKVSPGRTFQLGTKGTYVYSALLPAQGVPQLSLSQQEVRDLFALVS